MSDQNALNKVISHDINPSALNDCVKKIQARIIAAGDKTHVTVTRQLELLEQLAQFDFGAFLIQNGGANGYWTHYFLTHPTRGKITGKNNRGENLSSLEKNILEDLPIIIATQQRYEIFLRENQKSVQNKAKLACIPCGVMGELLYLNYAGVRDFALTGIDLDQGSIEHAQNLAREKNLSDKITLQQKDAWHLNITNEFDLVSSNGLNIYEPDHAKIAQLFAQFHQALAPSGKLVTSFLTYPPLFPDKSEWNMQRVDPEMLLLQRILFADILDVKFNCFMTINEARQILANIGFKNIEIFPDRANVFPTIVAIK